MTEATHVTPGKRVRHRPRPAQRARAVLIRPELGALIGTVAVFLFFAAVAGESGFLTQQGTFNYVEVAAEVGIMAVAVTLLMIAGEFDVSIGSMFGAAGVALAIPVVEWGWPLWGAIPFTFVIAAAIGAINGMLVVRTGLPSFIVTLAALFILRGVTISVTRAVTDGGSSVAGLHEPLGDDVLLPLFSGKVLGDMPVSLVWWIALVAIGTWILMATRFGNWILGTGGNAESARRLGVPSNWVKILLFVATACAAALASIIATLNANSANVQAGQLKEFEAIAATVIGGTLLTGGSGTVIGGAIGALLFGMVSQGIFFTGVDADLFQVFLGGILLAAVLMNQFIRSRVGRTR
jgi:simple sugar transport system permease protein